MNTRITRIAALGLTGVLAFGLTACEVEDGDPDTTIIEDDEPAEGDDTVIEEGDDTDVTVEDENTDDGTTEDDTDNSEG